MPQVVIIGAGLTGLSTAYHLENNNFFDYVLLEKDTAVGGLCKSVRQDGFTFDYTGHLLHISDPYIKKLVHDITNPDSFNSHARQSFIYSGGHWSKYPFQVNLRGMPVSVIAQCIEQFVRRPKIEQPKSFYSWVLTHFGAGFAQHFFVPYQEKIFCYDTKKLSHTWTGRFVPATTLDDIIAGIVDYPEKSIGYNAHFFYPKTGGIDYLVHALASRVIKPVLTKHDVCKIDLANKTVHCANGYSTRYTILINTSPLNQFLHNTRAPSTLELTSARRNLIASNVLNINVGLAGTLAPFDKLRASGGEKHWVYVVDKDIPFYRAGWAHLFSEHMAPKECRSLYLEHGYRTKPEKNIEKKIIAHAQKLFDFTLSDILTYNVLDINPAYVTYTHWRDKNLPALLERLREYGIYSGGRYGLWQYASMQEALLDGKKLAEQILEQTFMSSSLDTAASRPLGTSGDVISP